MELTVKRTTATKRSTMGELYINGKFECYTLEDVERAEKIKGQTAISKGRYEVKITMSNRFKKELPILLNVPNFEGVRIHSGNTSEQTEGCILLGRTKSADFIGESRLAMDTFMPKLAAALKTERVFITVV